MTLQYDTNVITKDMEQYIEMTVLQNSLVSIDVTLAFLNLFVVQSSLYELISTTIIAIVQIITWYANCSDKNKDTIRSLHQLCSCAYGVLIQEGNVNINFHASTDNGILLLLFGCTYTFSSGSLVVVVCGCNGISGKVIKAHQAVKKKIELGFLTGIYGNEFTLA